jgi:hypothetical protein
MVARQKWITDKNVPLSSDRHTTKAASQREQVHAPHFSPRLRVPNVLDAVRN